jgi:hypothetical protein
VIERIIMQPRSLSLVIAGVLSLSAPALADGFSVTLDAPISPNFSIGTGLNYSYEVIPNLFVGGSLNAVFVPSAPSSAQFGLSTRVGAKYVVQLINTTNTYVNVYTGAGVDLQILPSPISVSADVNAGVFARYGVGNDVKLYGGIDGALGYNFSVGVLNPEISAYAGVKFEPIGALSLYAQGAVGYNNISSVGTSGAGLVYDTRAGLYYDIVPQFRLGVYAGFNGGFLLGISGQYTMKPGTLATPGNYLP